MAFKKRLINHTLNLKVKRLQHCLCGKKVFREVGMGWVFTKLASLYCLARKVTKNLLRSCSCCHLSGRSTCWTTCYWSLRSLSCSVALGKAAAGGVDGLRRHSEGSWPSSRPPASPSRPPCSSSPCWSPAAPPTPSPPAPASTSGSRDTSSTPRCWGLASCGTSERKPPSRSGWRWHPPSTGEVWSTGLLMAGMAGHVSYNRGV